MYVSMHSKEYSQQLTLNLNSKGSTVNSIKNEEVTLETGILPVGAKNAKLFAILLTIFRWLYS